VELLLVLEADGDGDGAGYRARSLDVAVRLHPEATVAMLQDELASYARRTGLVPRTASTSLGLYRAGDRYALQAGARVTDSALVSGDTLVLRPVGARAGRRAGRHGARSSGVVLDVVGGPDSGTTVALEEGALTVGRSPQCALVVHDPTLSRHHFSLQVAAQRGGGLEVVVVPDPSARNGVLVEGELLAGSRRVDLGELVRAGDSLFVLRPAEIGDAPSGSGLVTVERRDLGGVRSAPARLVGGLAAGRRFARQRDVFYEQVERMALRVAQALGEERAERHAAAPDLAALGRWAQARPDSVAAAARGRRSLAPVRLGLGEVESRVTVGVAPGGVPELRRKANERLAHHRRLRDAPITVDWDGIGALGICGAPGQVLAAASALLLQAACRHGPDELVLAAAVSEAHLDRLDWLKWLPHLRSPRSGLGGDGLAGNPTAAAGLVGTVLDLVADRVGRGTPGPDGQWPRLLLAVDHEAEVPRRLLDRVIGVAPDHGIHVLWFGEDELLVPRRCGAVVSCAGSGKPARLRLAGGDGGNGNLAGWREGADGDLDGDGDGVVVAVDPDGVQPATARAIARSLTARWHDAADLPPRVPLLEALDLAGPRPDGVAERWRAPGAGGLVCTVGVGAAGACQLDLAGQGPGMLVGGGRGSGKTEALLAVALSLAVRLPPARLRFVVLDYGRGAGTSMLRDLPHTIRWLTASDGPAPVRQALEDLPGELARGAGAHGGPPPSLVILVDDHAALARHLPWAPAALAGLAGRTGPAGTHLVIASPYPVEVPEVCRARAGVRLALRAPGQQAAVSLVGTPDAADLPAALRGRGFLRLGPAAPVPVQCAWPSAPLSHDAAPRFVHVAPFAAGGQVTGIADSASTDGTPSITSSDGTAGTPTQGQALVDACAAAAALVSPPAGS
jgi:S-DNA-T family DNA segregation ATPase FtsK/SpoIIIE